jgi:hypothetical protein
LVISWPVRSHTTNPTQATPGDDREKVKALVAEKLREDPYLALLINAKGPIARERINIVMDLGSLSRWRNLAIDEGLSTSDLLARRVFRWIQSNSSEEAIRWASLELANRRRVAQIQKRALRDEGAQLEAGIASESLAYPLPLLNPLKKVWESTGLKKKAFLEGCIYLYMEIHRPS